MITMFVLAVLFAAFGAVFWLVSAVFGLVLPIVSGVFGILLKVIFFAAVLVACVTGSIMIFF